MENDDKVTLATQDGNLPAVREKGEIELRGMLEMLHNLIQDFQEKRPYNLEEEFVKSGRNRNHLIPVTVLVTLILFGAGLFGATVLIVKRYKDMALSVGSFEDLRLKDLLSEASRNQTDMERARQNLLDLEAALAGEIAAVERSAEQKLELLREEELPDAEREERTRGILGEKQAAAAAVRGIRRPQIEGAKAKIADIQGRIDAYDARLVEQARKQEKQLDNQKVLFEIERKKLVASYEERLKLLAERSDRERAQEKAHNEKVVAQLKANHAEEIARLIGKYNPDLSQSPAARYLAAALPAPAALTRNPYREILKTEHILEKSGLDALQEDSAAVSSILSVLGEIPWEPSIRNAVQNLQARSGRLGAGYEELWTALSQTLEAKAAAIEEQSALLRRYVYALEYQTGTSRENGYIIDPRNEKEMLVYMDPRRPVPSGSSGYIFRNDDEYIGTVRFQVSNGRLRASLDSLVSPEIKPAPFDKLLLRVD